MLPLIARKKDKLAYFTIFKVASSAIPRTFFSSLAEIERHEKEVNKKISGWNMMLSLARPKNTPREHTLDIPTFTSFTYAEKSKEWLARGYDEKTKSHQVCTVTKEEVQSYFTFTFVRNPFTRLVSCFEDKFFFNEEDNLFHAKYIGSVGKKEAFTGFADFLSTIATQKNKNMNEHFCPQISLLDTFREDGGNMAFIGKLENIEKDFEGLRKKYNLLPLEHTNERVKKKRKLLQEDWRDHYTPELAKLVFDRWRADFVQLGYENEYPKLLAYLGAPLPWRFRKRQLFAKLGLRAYKKYLA